MTLTKNDVVEVLARENCWSKRRSFKAIDILLELIKKKLGAGEYVKVSGFGKFCVKQKRERRGRNPANGQYLVLRSRRVVRFRCSEKLRLQINQKRIKAGDL